MDYWNSFVHSSLGWDFPRFRNYFLYLFWFKFFNLIESQTWWITLWIHHYTQSWINSKVNCKYEIASHKKNYPPPRFVLWFPRTDSKCANNELCWPSTTDTFPTKTIERLWILVELIQFRDICMYNGDFSFNMDFVFPFYFSTCNVGLTLALKKIWNCDDHFFQCTVGIE